MKKPSAEFDIYTPMMGIIQWQWYHGEALNLPFNLMSASDPNMKCQSFVAANLPEQQPTHWYCGMLEQRDGKACAKHPYASRCSPAPREPDIGICGTPCHPYSTQRAGRFKGDSVEQHAEYDVAMDQFLSWFKKFEPRAQIFEQVMGFEMPFEAGGDESPLSRFLSSMQVVPLGGHVMNSYLLFTNIMYVNSKTLQNS